MKEYILKKFIEHNFGSLQKKRKGMALLEVIGIIVVVVVLILIFKDKMIEIITNAINKIGEIINNLFSR